MPESRFRMFCEYKCKTLMPLNNILPDYTAVCTVLRPSSAPFKDNINKKQKKLVQNKVIRAPVLFFPYHMKY